MASMPVPPTPEVVVTTVIQNVFDDSFLRGFIGPKEQNVLNLARSWLVKQIKPLLMPQATVLVTNPQDTYTKARHIIGVSHVVYQRLDDGRTHDTVFRVTLNKMKVAAGGAPVTIEKDDSVFPIHVRLFPSDMKDEVAGELDMIRKLPQMFAEVDEVAESSQKLSARLTISIRSWRPLNNGNGTDYFTLKEPLLDDVFTELYTHFKESGLFTDGADEQQFRLLFEALKPHIIQTPDGPRMTEAFQGNTVVDLLKDQRAHDRDIVSPFLNGTAIVQKLQMLPDGRRPTDGGAAAVPGGRDGASASRVAASPLGAPGADGDSGVRDGGSAPWDATPLGGSHSTGNPLGDAGSPPRGPPSGDGTPSAAATGSVEQGPAQLTKDFIDKCGLYKSMMEEANKKSNVADRNQYYTDAFESPDMSLMFATVYTRLAAPLLDSVLKWEDWYTRNRDKMGNSRGRRAGPADLMSYATWKQTRVPAPPAGPGPTEAMQNALDNCRATYLRMRKLTGTADESAILTALYKKAHYVPKPISVVGNENVTDSLNAVLSLPNISSLSFGKTFTSLLMWGPPGTGKTILAQAAAFNAKYVMFPIQAADVMGGYVGDSEKKVKLVFDIAKNIASCEHIDGCVLFFDEIDLMVPNRQSGSSSGKSNTEGALSMFLTELTNLDSDPAGKNIVVAAATNLKNKLDAALLRRFSMQPHVSLPSVEACKTMLNLNLKKTMHRVGMPIDGFADLCHKMKFTGADINRAVKEASQLSGKIFRKGQFAEYHPMQAAAAGENVFTLTAKDAGVLPITITVYDPDKMVGDVNPIADGQTVWCPILTGTGGKPSSDLTPEEKKYVYTAGITAKQLTKVLTSFVVSTPVQTGDAQRNSGG